MTSAWHKYDWPFKGYKTQVDIVTDSRFYTFSEFHVYIFKPGSNVFDYNYVGVINPITKRVTRKKHVHKRRYE